MPKAESSSNELTLREALLSDSYEEQIARLKKRIEELEAIRADPDYKGAIARRYAFHILDLPIEELTHEQYRDRLVGLFLGAIREALEVASRE